MRDPEDERERYIGLPAATRMGHLASDLLRLSRWLRTRCDDEAVVALMGRIASMMEWNPEHASEELADMQREVCYWRRLWPQEAARGLLAFRARRMSDRILELSGLLEPAGTAES
jgi:hypothetical protein